MADWTRFLWAVGHPGGSRPEAPRQGVPTPQRPDAADAAGLKSSGCRGPHTHSEQLLMVVSEEEAHAPEGAAEPEEVVVVRAAERAVENAQGFALRQQFAVLGLELENAKLRHGISLLSGEFLV